ncbi:MAG: Ricin lectin [Streptosporangiaceae bacterium]|nr:Ricin lectin [Streptosporangiaceae bacterium]
MHNGDGGHGQVDYTIEYYTMGHLTKFVRPGAHRIASTASTAVPNVAWRNPDGAGSTANGAQVQLYDCNGSGAQQWAGHDRPRPGEPAGEQVPGRDREQQRQRHPLQTWDRTGGANHKWTVPGR